MLGIQPMQDIHVHEVVPLFRGLASDDGGSQM